MELDAFSRLFFWAKVFVPLVLILAGLFVALTDALFGAGIALSSVVAFVVFDYLQYRANFG
jgi:hypothetical protein